MEKDAPCSKRQSEHTLHPERLKFACTLQQNILANSPPYLQDWARLRKCIAPTLRIDYRSFLNKIWEAMPADEFITMASDPHVLGDKTLKTQHFQGASKWER